VERPVLVVVDGNKQAETLADLMDDERRILAKWAGKTAIIESHAVGAECPVDRKYLCRWAGSH
jgi:hypothetical protein